MQNSGRFRRREGLALISVVLLIAFCSLILVGTSRQTLKVRLQAIRLQENLQSKWGRATLERHLIEIAPKDLRLTKNRTRNRARFNIRLGKWDFVSILSDEQAKFNLSTMLKNRSKAYVENKLAREMKLERIDLHPNKDDPANLGSTSFNSWGQVFDLKSLSRNDQADFIIGRTAYITLWGSGGKLNYRNANEDVVKTVLRLAVSSSKARRFVRSLGENREKDLESLFRIAGFNDQEQVNVKKLFSETTSCYSVMTKSQKNSQRNWRYVVSEKIGSQTKTWTFSW